MILSRGQKASPWKRCRVQDVAARTPPSFTAATTISMECRVSSSPRLARHVACGFKIHVLLRLNWRTYIRQPMRLIILHRPPRPFSALRVDSPNWQPISRTPSADAHGVLVKQKAVGRGVILSADWDTVPWDQQRIWDTSLNGWARCFPRRNGGELAWILFRTSLRTAQCWKSEAPAVRAWSNCASLDGDTCMASSCPGPPPRRRFS